MQLQAPDMQALLGVVVAGRIRLEELLGVGAMGAVFRGHHQTLDKSVAVKILRRQPDGELRNDVFAREARTAAQLDHPHIVSILDFGEDGPEGLAYIAMEFLEGMDLEKLLIAEGPMECRRLATLMVQATGAMAAAHERGIIHRDLKPANLMVLSRRDDDGVPVQHVKVCDFGLAKIVGLNGATSRDTGPSTLTAAVVGTPAYMSPEQAVGEVLDERTDIYALGIVMYEMACGAPPFDSESYVGLLTQHVTRPPKPLRQVAPAVEPGFELIVHRCLEKMRDQRYATARDLRQALREFLESRVGAYAQTDDLVVEEPIESLPLDAILGTGSSMPAEPAAVAQVHVVEPFPPVDGPLAPHASSGDLELLIAEAVDGVRDEIKAQSGDLMGSGLDPFKAALLEEVNAGSTTGSIDRRHHAAAVSDRAQYMWRHYGIRFEPHDGNDPYWVLDHRESALGPLCYSDAMKILSHLARAQNLSKVKISADSSRWIEAQSFLALTGQELIVTGDIGSSPPDSGGKQFEGTFKATTPTALMGRVARERLSGRFYFRRKGFDGTDRVVLHVASGAPTFVYSSDPEMQLPRLILSKGILAEGVVPIVLHRALAEGQPLGGLIACDTGIDLGLYRAVFMKERLASIFGWKEHGSYVFVPGRVDEELPFSASALSVVTDIVYRTMALPELAGALHPHWSAPIVRSERFGKGVKQMGLARGQLDVVRTFQTGRTIGDVLNGCTPAEQQMYYTMAYILLEADLLLRPIP